MGQVIRDKDGHTLGHFLTDAEYRALLQAYVGRPFDEAQHEQTMRQHREDTLPPGKTTEEVLAMMKEWESKPPVPR